MVAGARSMTSNAAVGAPGVTNRSYFSQNTFMRRYSAARSRSAQASRLAVCFRPSSVFQMMSGLNLSRCSWICSSRSTTNCWLRNAMNTSSTGPKSGEASSTMQPSSSKRRAMRLQISRMSWSISNLPPKSMVMATLFGFTGAATAAPNETAGASKVIASCGQKPAIVSRKSARSATLRAIGPCTDCGE